MSERAEDTAGGPARRRGPFHMPPYADALLLGLLAEMSRIYMNIKQEEWDERELFDLVPGLTYNPYYSGDCTCAPDKHDAQCPRMQPNLAFEDVQISWYKHSLRGQMVNKVMTPDAWASWYDRCHAAICAADSVYRYTRR